MIIIIIGAFDEPPKAASVGEKLWPALRAGVPS